MTQPRPSAAEMVDAVREFLEADLMPTLQGRQQFHARVAANVLGAVGRELRDGPANDLVERGRLTDLLGQEGTAEELSARLAAAIRSGELEIGDRALLDHLRATARADLAIANPRYAPPYAPGDHNKGSLK